MRKYLFSSKGWFIAYFLTLLFNQTLIISVALYLKYVVDAAAAADEAKLIQSIYYGLAFVLLLFIIEFLRRMCRAKYIRNTILKLKRDVFAGLMKNSITDFTQTNSAGYISILNNNVKTIEDGYISNFFSIVQDVLKLIIALGMMFYLSPIVAVATIAFSFLPLLIPTIFGKKLAILQGTYMKSLEVFNEKIKDFLMGFEVIKTFKVEKNVQNNFEHINVQSENEKYRVNKTNAFVNALGNMLSVSTQFSIFLVAGFFVINGQLSVGAIVAVTQLSGNIVAPLMSLIQERNLMKSVKLVNKKVYEIIKTNSTDGSGKEINQFNKRIEFRNVSFSYDGHGNVIENINYTFERGKKYAIVGGSGSGKSTLLKLLLRYFNNYKGEIVIDDLENRSININSLYKICSIIHQNVFIFDDNLRNNITLYNNYSDAAVAEAIKKSGLEGVVKALDDGLSAKIGESGNNLSGGEKQRIAIARALIKGSDILILDEATANLDNETAYSIENSLLDIPDLTCLLVTHRYNKELLKRYDSILVLKDGHLSEVGSFDELIEQKGYFYSLYNVAQ